MCKVVFLLVGLLFSEYANIRITAQSQCLYVFSHHAHCLMLTCLSMTSKAIELFNITKHKRY